MPNIESGAGRLVPASQLEFSRYAKNLAWLLEAPLHFARDLLAASYGFGSVHELQAALPGLGDKDMPTGPFDEPRARPPFYPTHLDVPGTAENRLAPLSAREARLLRFCENVFHSRPEKEGRLRRRHYCVLDGAFFSAPSVHRRQFAALKQGILAMEGPSEGRERYLEQHWPPAFWSYLEATHLSRVDAEAGLAELKGSSVYFEESDVMSIGDMFHATAAHRAPAIYLAMVGEDPAPLPGLPMYGEHDDWFDELPSVASAGSPGLFPCYDDEHWYAAMDELVADVDDDLRETLLGLDPHEIADSAPAGTPPALVAIARKWRLHQLRALCKIYVESKYVDRHVASCSEMFWPGSEGNTVTEVSELVWSISRSAPSLMLYSEFSERSRVSDEMEANRQLWEFKTLLTRSAPNEAEDVVGYMAGWLVVLATDNTVCNDIELREDAGYYDAMLAEGVEAFFNKYMTYAGFDDLLQFVNSRWHSAIAITELVLRPKYRKQGLASLAFTGFTSAHQNAPYTDRPDGWLEWADFELESDADISDREAAVYITPPSVYLVPVRRENKKLRRYLSNLSPPDELGVSDDEDLEVFPFHYELPDAEDAEQAV